MRTVLFTHFINNHLYFIINYYFYWLLLPLHKIFAKTKQYINKTNNYHISIKISNNFKDMDKRKS